MATDVSAPLPQVYLQPLSVLTVTVDDPGAVITQINVHGWQTPSGGGVLDNAPDPLLVPVST